MSKSRPRRSSRRASRRSGMNPLVPIAIGGALLVLVGVLLALNQGGQQQTAQGDIPFPRVPRTTLAEARELIDDNQALVVDVRGPEEYAAAHIPGALSIPLTQIETRIDELPRDATIITYCT